MALSPPCSGSLRPRDLKNFLFFEWANPVSTLGFALDISSAWNTLPYPFSMTGSFSSSRSQCKYNLFQDSHFLTSNEMEPWPPHAPSYSPPIHLGCFQCGVSRTQKLSRFFFGSLTSFLLICPSPHHNRASVKNAGAFSLL